MDLGERFPKLTCRHKVSLVLSRFIHRTILESFTSQGERGEQEVEVVGRVDARISSQNETPWLG